MMEEQIEEFVKAADEILEEHWKANNFTFSLSPVHKAEYLDKWVRIVTVERRHDGSTNTAGVYAFICLKDNVTKSLGQVKAGDIHKAATYKAPAKHARANVFEADFRKALTAHGIIYLNSGKTK